MKDKKRMIARVILTVLTVAAIAAIFYNSSLSAVESTEQSSPLTDWINSILASLHFPFTLTEKFIRKLAHFSEYSALGILLSTTVYLYRRDRKKTLLTALPIGAAVAVCDELIQLFPAGRSCQVSDMVIDTCGIAFGTLIVLLFILIKEKRSIKKRMEKKEG
ncbi:MAG: VanZ family protein [Ruminococcus sp.]|uniref:VanZ family protein n=1 Tax=Ruminococcus sp. TaxID=41978 RepID=UPI002873C35C|nr:VanZ family protein [Ruminococcus sp.]MBQ3284374.1 VanZ family protein [Ruminococcus sp.]